MKRNQKSIKIKAYAKLNLYLKITGLMKNGFHSLKTLFVSVNIYDDITIKFLPADKLKVSVYMEGYPDLPQEKNTAYAAAALYAEKAGLKGGLTLKIKKRIPEGAGLGGSSADAAGVLRGLNLMFEKLTEKELLKLAEKTGSDVPFLIKGGFAYATGRGEKLKFFNFSPQVYFVIIYPGFKIESKRAYAEFDKLTNKNNLTLNIPFNRIKSCLRIEDWKTLCRNDFYYAAEAVGKKGIYAKIHKTLLKNGADGASLTGSGSAYIGVFKRKNSAAAAAAALKKVFPSYSVFRTERKESY